MDGRRLMDRAGWEALLHGVFAIAMTLLVLDIKVPTADGTPTASALVDALIALAPRYLAYAIGFIYVGVYWMTTYRSLQMFQGVDNAALVLGLVFLMSVALVPFVASLLAEYIGSDQGRSQVVVLAFLGWLFVVSALANVAMWHAARAGLIGPGLGEGFVRARRRDAAAASGVWFVAVIAAFFIGPLALLVPAASIPMTLRFLSDAAEKPAVAAQP